MRVREKGCRLVGLCLVICLTNQADALQIEVDPGPVGSMPAVAVMPFAELDGMTFDGSQHSLDFVFSSRKRLELELEGLVQYRVELEFDHDGDYLDSLEFPSSFPTAFLSDEQGDPIIMTTNTGAGQETGKFHLIGMFVSPGVFSPDPPSEHVVDGLIHYDVHVNLTLPSSGDLITGAELRLRFLPLFDSPGTSGNPLGSGTILVGQIPEPAAAALACVALCILAGIKRRRC